jgi:hypothetical protein
MAAKAIVAKRSASGATLITKDVISSDSLRSSTAFVMRRRGRRRPKQHHRVRAKPTKNQQDAFS